MGNRLEGEKRVKKSEGWRIVLSGVVRFIDRGMEEENEKKFL